MNQSSSPETIRTKRSKLKYDFTVKINEEYKHSMAFYLNASYVSGFPCPYGLEKKIPFKNTHFF